MNTNYPTVKLSLPRRKKADEKWIQGSWYKAFEAEKSIANREVVRISQSGIKALKPEKQANPLKNYKKIRDLGSGYFGEVALYRHKGVDYAVKTFRKIHSPMRISADLAIEKKEMFVSLLVSGFKPAVRTKKILIGKDASHIVMECLSPISKQDPMYDSLKKDREDAFKEKFGITLLDRHRGNHMKRDDQEVQIDYGLLNLGPIYKAQKEARAQALEGDS